jgi:hypothetical protein
MYSLFPEAAQYANDMRVHLKAEGCNAALIDMLADAWLERFNEAYFTSRHYLDTRVYFERRLEVLRRPIRFEEKYELIKQLDAGPHRNYEHVIGSTSPRRDGREMGS